MQEVIKINVPTIQGADATAHTNISLPERGTFRVVHVEFGDDNESLVLWLAVSVPGKTPAVGVTSRRVLLRPTQDYPYDVGVVGAYPLNVGDDYQYMCSSPYDADNGLLWHIWLEPLDGGATVE